MRIAIAQRRHCSSRGARQIGKTFSIREAARRNYECFVEINFVTSPEAVGIFRGAKDVQEMLF